jgi:putative DNA primase/helicase
MLAVVQGSDGHAVTLHRTYLRDGRKALGAQSRKVLSSGINGAAVRLFEAGDELAVAEGIETALAVHLSTGKPVWAALSCGNLEKLWIPDPVARVCIYADNDATPSSTARPRPMPWRTA